MDPVPTYPLPNPPPVDLGDIIARTNGAAHQMMPYVEGYYSTLEQRTAAAEAALKKAAQPLTRSLGTRTSMATKRLATAVQPVADMLAERTTAAQRGMLDYPVPVATATSVWWALVDSATCEGSVTPADRGSPPNVTEPVRSYGPFQSQAQAAQAVETYRTYLQAQGLCAGGTAVPGPAVLDWYWVEGP